MADLPVACTLTPEALRTRRSGLLAGLLRRAERQNLIGDGARLEFRPDSETVSAIAEAVDAERQCCRFFRFSITVEPDNGPIFLELTGPAGTREFVAGWLDV